MYNGYIILGCLALPVKELHLARNWEKLTDHQTLAKTHRIPEKDPTAHSDFYIFTSC